MALELMTLVTMLCWLYCVAYTVPQLFWITLYVKDEPADLVICERY